MRRVEIHFKDQPAQSAPGLHTMADAKCVIVKGQMLIVECSKYNIMYPIDTIKMVRERTDSDMLKEPAPVHDQGIRGCQCEYCESKEKQ